MMKLRNLVDDRVVAKRILESWSFNKIDYDVMDEFRRSATAIYPFIDNDHVYILRFSPEDEKSKSFIEAELDYIDYLRSAGVKAPKSVVSKQKNILETVNVDGVNYHANVFERVKGQRVDRIELDQTHFYKLGQSLGRLHLTTENYKPSKAIQSRPCFNEKLNWAQKVLLNSSGEGKTCHKEALEVISALRSRLNNLPKDSQNFGLIHYDYDLDNIFYDSDEDQVWIIDFDDAIYHWYYLDLVNFHECLKEEFVAQEAEDAIEVFNKGYESIRTIDPLIKAEEDVLRLYSDVISYCVFVYATSELTDAPPQWMLDIKAKLNQKMMTKRHRFNDWLQ